MDNKWDWGEIPTNEHTAIPEHPRSRLSMEARARITAAETQAGVLRIRTHAAIESRWRVEAPDTDLKDYITRGDAAVELDQLKIAMTTAVLPVLFREYIDAGAKGADLWQILEAELDISASSLDMRPIQRNVLLMELKSLWDGAASSQTSAPITATNSLQGRASAISIVRPKGIDDLHQEHLRLLNLVLHKIKGAGAIEPAILEFCRRHQGLSRTQITDYRGGRIAGKISPEKRTLIEEAIARDAREFGFLNSE